MQTHLFGDIGAMLPDMLCRVLVKAHHGQKVNVTEKDVCRQGVVHGNVAQLVDRVEVLHPQILLLNL